MYVICPHSAKHQIVQHNLPLTKFASPHRWFYAQGVCQSRNCNNNQRGPPRPTYCCSAAVVCTATHVPVGWNIHRGPGAEQQQVTYHNGENHLDHARVAEVKRGSVYAPAFRTNNLNTNNAINKRKQQAQGWKMRLVQREVLRRNILGTVSAKEAIKVLWCRTIARRTIPRCVGSAAYSRCTAAYQSVSTRGSAAYSSCTQPIIECLHSRQAKDPKPYSKSFRRTNHTKATCHTQRIM